MAKQSGLGYSVAVNDAGGVARTISNDITNFDYATPRGVQDITGVDKSAHERLLLLADFSITFTGVFNNAANQSHDVFKTVSSTSVNRTVTLAITSPASVTSTLANQTLFSDYHITRGTDGALTWQAPGVLADGTVPTWS
jgi:hypothetical protein